MRNLLWRQEVENLPSLEIDDSAVAEVALVPIVVPLEIDGQDDADGEDSE